MSGSQTEIMAFLSKPETYGFGGEPVEVHTTHGSVVFLAGAFAYKLKRAVHFPYMDYSTLARRKAMCEAELDVNRRLAPELYLDVRPVIRAGDGTLLIGSAADADRALDWLVVMRRLNRDNTLERALACGKIDLAWIERLENLLLEFYRHARPARLTCVRRIEEWGRLLRTNRDVLLRSRFALPIATVLEIDRSQRQFLDRCACLMAERQREGRIVNGHGDLRPEHVFVNATISIIDCLEFNAGLRAIDPFEEIACLAVECERRGEDWIGHRLFRRMTLNLPAPAPRALVAFYMSYRATLRARLCVAHLLEPHPRTPERWRPLALVYLAIARKHAAELLQMIKVRTNRSSRDPRAAVRWRQRKAPRRLSRVS
jgi:aminoglycoside phosphotransferase family enzyme